MSASYGRASFSLVLLVLIVSAFGSVASSHAVDVCSQAGVFMVLTDSSNWYALIGIDPGKISGANASTPISVTGSWGGLPNYSDFLHPDYTFKGNIYVSQYVFQGQTYAGSGLSQIPTLGQSASVTGTLAWSNSACVQALQQSGSPIIDAWNALLRWLFSLGSLFSW